MVVAKTSIFYSTLLGGWCKEGFSLKMHEKGFLLLLSCSHENSILVISYLSLAGCLVIQVKKKSIPGKVAVTYHNGALKCIKKCQEAS